MKLREVRVLIEDAILKERERCAKAAENSPIHEDCARIAAMEIRSAEPPTVTVVRPETALAKPEKLGPHTIVAGQALVDDKIVDRFRTPELSR